MRETSLPAHAVCPAHPRCRGPARRHRVAGAGCLRARCRRHRAPRGSRRHCRRASAVRRIGPGTQPAPAPKNQPEPVAYVAVSAERRAAPGDDAVAGGPVRPDPPGPQHHGRPEGGFVHEDGFWPESCEVGPIFGLRGTEGRRPALAALSRGGTQSAVGRGRNASSQVRPRIGCRSERAYRCGWSVVVSRAGLSGRRPGDDGGRIVYAKKTRADSAQQSPAGSGGALTRARRPHRCRRCARLPAWNRWDEPPGHGAVRSPWTGRCAFRTR